ncbi:hypothetical protein KF707C_14050 [Metapseudomonas furukawaii]|uniref:Uncharacterized protein n=1 Tax=Metapseudomonas furukawaii TaxID=1149133 RepID=A0AAD1FF23_METFU|nr:hypothetical protein KF707C_14050 [Pseudomonas furukawaii]
MCPNCIYQAFSDLLQETIALSIAERFIDLPEVVDLNMQQRQRVM